MCWKDELYATRRNLERAETHLKRVQDKLKERAEKRKETLERAKRSDIRNQAQSLYLKYSSANDACMTSLECIKTAKKLIGDVIQKVAISRKKKVER
jgi:hypothetical protein